jgi:hypothetical protein
VFFGSVEVALAEFGNLSDREIAKVCAVSPTTVSAARAQLSNLDSSPAARLGADGKTRKLPAKQAVGIKIDVAEWVMALKTFSEPNAKATAYTMDDKEHDAFVVEILKRGDAAAKAAAKAGKRGSKAKKAAPDFLAQYRALSGAEKTAFAAANSHRIFAAFSR